MAKSRSFQNEIPPSRVNIRYVTTHGDYMEIDTEEDYALANRDWPKRLDRTEARDARNK